ncbi:MAG: 3-hydroxybutyryl-CoA dehydrogenase [Pseudomonadota bacterium]|nr:3-hydroxybutyryl-CoA dehydrogenase [Pseudomonadota bacterium]
MNGVLGPNIVALGAGRMGRGIAHAFAYSGHDVTILDFKERSNTETDALLAQAKEEIGENLQFLASLGVLQSSGIAPVLNRIRFAPYAKAEAVLSAAEFIFEGVSETIEAKADALTRASTFAPKAVFASTTSTMLSTELAEHAKTPENFLNAHFLNPAYLIPLVEVSPHASTAEDVVVRFTALLQSIGKVPVHCNPSPGYIVPRLQAGAMNEAARMVEEGVASPEDIDKAVRAGFGIRYATMGFIEFTDYGGVDILYHASKYLAGKLDPRFAPPDIIVEKLQAGDLGLKTGKGFYDFEAMDADEYRREKLATFIGLLRHLDLMPKSDN